LKQGRVQPLQLGPAGKHGGISNRELKPLIMSSTVGSSGLLSISNRELKLTRVAQGGGVGRRWIEHLKQRIETCLAGAYGSLHRHVGHLKQRIETIQTAPGTTTARHLPHLKQRIETLDDVCKKVAALVGGSASQTEN